MQVKAKSSDLSKAFKLCASVIDAKDESRSNVEIVAEAPNKLRLKATNQQFSVTCVCEAEVGEESCDGEVIVDCRTIANIISKSKGECVISADEKNATIKANGKTKIPNIGKELPMVKEVDDNGVIVDCGDFKNAFGKVAYCISTDQTRLILTGAHIVTNGEVMTITALDGFRLAQTQIPCKGEAIDVVVPSRVLSVICEAIGSGELRIYTNGVFFTAHSDTFRINAVMLSGTYIDTARIIPTEFKTHALVETIGLQNVLDSATVASGEGNLVKIDFDVNNEQIVVRSNSMGTNNSVCADFDAEIHSLITGNAITIAFNLKYLIQSISHISAEDCVLQMNTEVSPVVISPKGNYNKDIHLILPVRVFNG